MASLQKALRLGLQALQQPLAARSAGCAMQARSFKIWTAPENIKERQAAKEPEKLSDEPEDAKESDKSSSIGEELKKAAEHAGQSIKRAATMDWKNAGEGKLNLPEEDTPSGEMKQAAEHVSNAFSEATRETKKKISQEQ